MIKTLIIGIIFLFAFSNIYTQASEVIENPKNKFYIGYDLGEMAFNEFQNFAGEIGIGFKNDHVLNFVYLNIKLTEWHLSSGFAKAVTGDNVTGHWVGYEFAYNVPVLRFKKKYHLLYTGLIAGNHKNSYSHTILDESVVHQSWTIGLNLGYRENDIFRIKGLYYNLQIPIRFNFTSLEETGIGDAVVNKKTYGQTISFFVGYQF